MAGGTTAMYPFFMQKKRSFIFFIVEGGFSCGIVNYREDEVFFLDDSI